MRAQRVSPSATRGCPPLDPAGAGADVAPRQACRPWTDPLAQIRSSSSDSRSARTRLHSREARPGTDFCPESRPRRCQARPAPDCPPRDSLPPRILPAQPRSSPATRCSPPNLARAAAKSAPRQTARPRTSPAQPRSSPRDTLLAPGPRPRSRKLAPRHAARPRTLPAQPRSSPAPLPSANPPRSREERSAPCSP